MTASVLWSYCAVLLARPLLSAAELSTYRGFQFGMDLSAAAQAGGDRSV